MQSVQILSKKLAYKFSLSVNRSRTFTTELRKRTSNRAASSPPAISISSISSCKEPYTILLMKAARKGFTSLTWAIEWIIIAKEIRHSQSCRVYTVASHRTKSKSIITPQNKLDGGRAIVIDQGILCGDITTKTNDSTTSCIINFCISQAHF